MANAIDTIVSKEAIKGLTELELKLKNSVAEIIKLSEEARKASGNLSKINTPKDLNANNTNNSKLTADLQKQATIVAGLQKQTVNLTAAKAQSNVRTAEEIVNTRVLTQNANRQASATSVLAGAYANLSAQQAIASKRYQDLIVRGKLADQTQRQYNQELRTAQTQFQSLNTRVLAADRAVGRFNRNVGNYPKQAILGIGNLMRAFGMVGGLMLFANIVKGAFNTVKEFDKASADLAATLGKSRKEISGLTDNAKQLGATTKFTATEIIGLQKELGKLGFSEQEILNSTAAISQLAAAVDTDLATAALVAGQTLRAFNYEATDMQRVVDVMAKSFTSSALDISNFTESMKFVAPVAAASNISIEQTAALLGVLADNGIKGSMAGTSLRRILTDLTMTGKPFAEALREVSKNGISVKDAFDEVGRTAQTSLLILGKNIPKVEALGIAFENAGGSAQKMADEQLKSLSGQLTLLTSAYDGFILSALEGESSLSNFLQVPIKNITLFLTLSSAAFTSNEKLRQGFLQRQKEEGTANAKEILSKITDTDEKKAYAEEAIVRTRKEIAKNTAEFNKLLSENAEIESSKTNKRQVSPIQKENEERLIQLNNLSSRLVGYVEGLRSVLKVESKIVESTIEETAETKKNTKEKRVQIEGIEAQAKSYESLLMQLESQVSILKEVQTQFSNTSEDYQYYQKLIEDTQKYIDAIKDSENSLAGSAKAATDRFKEQNQAITQNKEALIELQRATDDYIRSFQEGFLADANLSSLQIFFDGTFSKLMQGADTLQEKFAVTFLAISEVAKEAFNFINSASQRNFDAEYGRLEQQKEVALQFAGESTSAQLAITEQYDERRRAIQIREAEAQKKLAVFNILINTAQGVVSALVSTPPNVPLSIAIGVIGAFQAATVASQQIPAFFEGGEHDGGLMLVNDGKGANYKETIVTPDGKIIKPQGRDVVMDAPKGTQIYTHDQWQTQMMRGLLSQGITGNKGNGLTKDDFNSGIERLIKSTNRNSGGFSFDERGITKWKSNNGQRTKVLNNRLFVKGN